MNLHQEIMNLPITVQQPDDQFFLVASHYYKEGHKDARHAAAELALKADRLIEDMKDELQGIIVWLQMGDYSESFTESMEQLIERAEKLK